MVGGGGGRESDELQSFLLLAKGMSASASSDVWASFVGKILRSRDVFVFAEIMELEGVEALKSSGDASARAAHKLLEIFSHGTVEDYYVAREGKEEGMMLPKLDEAQMRKLRMLTVVSAAQSSNGGVISYSDLLRALRMDTARDLESLLVSCVYSGLIKGKLDQRAQCMRTTWTMGRDVGAEELDGMIDRLDKWCASASTLVDTLGKCAETKTASLMNEEESKEEEKEEEKISDIARVDAILEQIQAMESSLAAARGLVETDEMMMKD